MPEQPLCHVCLLTCASLALELAILFQCTSNITTSLMHPNLHNWQRKIGFMPIPFLHTGNLPSSVTCPAFLLLIIISVFLTLSFNPFDSSALLQTSSVCFKQSSVSETPSHQHKAVLLDILI